MNGKMKKKSLQNTYIKKLRNSLKKELAIIYLTSDDKKFLNEYQAIIHESELEDRRKNDRRWEQMKTNIAELVLEVLKKERWGIFFKNEPIQALPVQDNTTLYKVNEVKEDALLDSIEQEMERIDEWQKHQAKEEQNQTTKESLSGMNPTLRNTEE